MSIESKLSYLFDTKEEIREAIQEKGVSVPSSTTFRAYADKIREIETGSAIPPEIELNLQEKTAEPTGQEFEVYPDEDYDGLSKVVVTGDVNLKPENIAYGVTIYGITGTMEVKAEMTNIPAAYQAYFDQARLLYDGDYDHLMILESNTAVAFGFMLEGFTVESFDDSNSEFTASKWVYVAYNKKTGVWKVEDWTDDTSNGGSYTKNIRYSDTYIYYLGRLIWPYVDDQPIETPDIYETFSFEIKLLNVPNAGDTRGIHISGDGIIDWGDGETTQFDGSYLSEVVEHTYSYDGVDESNDRRIITITGRIYAIGQYVRNGPIMSSYGWCYLRRCTRVFTPLPGRCLEAKSLFFESPIYEIPHDFFSKSTRIKNLDSCFYNAKNLTALPPNLLHGLENLESIVMFLYGASSITTLPSSFFQGLTKLENIKGAFSYTKINNIPQSLFEDCESLTSCEGTFYNTNITSLPLGLFSRGFDSLNLNSCFYGCENIVSIPSGFFNGINSGNFYWMFAGCSHLEHCPSNILDDVETVQSVEGMFVDCSGYLENLPELWTKSYLENVEHSGCFQGCLNASNYADVPSDWK